MELLTLLEEAKTKVRDPETIKMAEAAYVKLKEHLCYLGERLVPLALFSAAIADIRTKPVLITNKCSKKKILGQNFSNILLDRTHGSFLNRCIGRNRPFLTKKVPKWSIEKSYLSLKEVVAPIRVGNNCAERSLGLVTDCHIDRITKSEEENSISTKQLPS